MAMNLGGGGGVKSDINVTPLVDVMLVLLIIMMIVAPLIQQGAQVTLPQATNTSEKPDTQEQTVVTIGADKSIYINAVLAQGSLRGRLDEIFENKTDKTVYIKADQDVEYKVVMDTMDELRAAGIEDMGLITDPPSKADQGGD